jgi:hypothetical protein
MAAHRKKQVSNDCCLNEYCNNPIAYRQTPEGRRLRVGGYCKDCYERGVTLEARKPYVVKTVCYPKPKPLRTDEIENYKTPNP